MRRIYGLLAIVALAVVLLGGAVAAQTSWLELDNDVRIKHRLLNDGAARFLSSVEVEGALVVGGVITGDGGLTINGALAGSHLPVYGPFTVTTDGSQADCSKGGLVLLTSSGNVQTSKIVTTAVEGVQCIILNEANTTITFSDTASLKLAGNASITQDDTLCLVSANSVWYQTCKNAN